MGKMAVGRKRVLEGLVVSDKMAKTIVVKVHRKVVHPVYKKTVIRDTKFKAHDPQGKAKTGDRVRIVESRPFSKEKKFQLLEVIHSASGETT